MKASSGVLSIQKPLKVLFGIPLEVLGIVGVANMSWFVICMMLETLFIGFIGSILGITIPLTIFLIKGQKDHHWFTIYQGGLRFWKSAKKRNLIVGENPSISSRPGKRKKGKR